jgi:MFS family permease
MSDARNVFFLILAVMLIQLPGGLTGTLTPLALGELDTGPVGIGVIAALHAAGFMFGSWVSPRALSQFGNVRLYAVSCGLLAASFLTLALIQHPLWWAVMRLVQGAFFAFVFTSIESWLGAAVPARSRGNLVGLYHTMAKVAILAGPFFIAGLTALDTRAYVWTALFFALALLPVCLTRQSEPPVADRKVMPALALYRIAPAAVIGAFMSGVANTGVTAFLPDYFKDFEIGGGGTQAAAFGGAAVWLAAIFSQWPAGVISDRADRRLVVCIMSGVSGLALAALALFAMDATEALRLILLGVWGAGALSFYGVCVAHAIDRSKAGEVTQVMSSILYIWAAGSIIGPVLAGLVNRVFGFQGLFLMSGVMLLGLAFYMLWRVRARPARDDTPVQAADWAALIPTPLPPAPPEADSPPPKV